jgi:hypothetical protein
MALARRRCGRLHLEGKMDQRTRRQVGLGAVVLLALLVVAVGLAVYVSKLRIPEGGADGTAAPAPEVDAFTLHDEYARNVAAADGKYRNQRIRIRGQVLAIESVSGKYAVGLFAPPKMLSGGGFREPGETHDRLQAAIAKAEAERDNPRNIEPGVVAIFSSQSEVAKLRNDDAIIVDGICAGREDARGRNRGTWVVIDHATIVPLPPKEVVSPAVAPQKNKNKTKLTRPE